MLKLGGFLILGHDVDKYTPAASNRLWDQVIVISMLNSLEIMSTLTSITNDFFQFGFEKMQSFSGALSQLNVWSKKLSKSQISALSQCSGEKKEHCRRTSSYEPQKIS